MKWTDRIGRRVKLRDLHIVLAVAEAGSMTVAAEQRLHTSQPSLSRQIRDLEDDVGVPLLHRSAQGVEVTAAGRAFLDHARLALAQADISIAQNPEAGIPTMDVVEINRPGDEDFLDEAPDQTTPSARAENFWSPR